MTSTIATMATEANNRLMVVDAGTGAEPTTAQMSDFIRLAFKELIAVLPPVKDTTLTLSTLNRAALTHDQAFYVAVNGLLLFPWEWATQGEYVKVQPASAAINDTLTVWYVAYPTITTGSTATVDTSCIFGNDWLEELALLRGMMAASQRMANVSATAGGDSHASWFRVLQDDYQRLYQAHWQRYQDWRQSMEMALSARAGNGPAPRTVSPHAGFRNRSGVHNWLTGARPKDQ